MSTQDSGIRFEIGGGASDFAQHADKAADVRRRLEGARSLFAEEPSASLEELEQNLRAWTRSHRDREAIGSAIALARRAREEFSALVTIGVGGSDLSARVFHDTLNHPYHNALPAEERGGAPGVYFTGDTFDPFRLRGLLDVLEGRGALDETLFNVISKSGRTLETIATLVIIGERLQPAGSGVDVHGWHRQVVATTGLKGASELRKLHEQSPFFGDTLLPVPEGVGGRFSAFSPVGVFLLAATAGRRETPEGRVEEAMEGVREADELFGSPHEDAGNVAYRLAEWLELAEAAADRSTLVFYNYADNRCLGDWFVQLYEESIQERGRGMNVIAARGPTSNHSLLNGVLLGPRDKAVLFIQWDDLGDDLDIPGATGIGGMESFEGLRMSQAQTASYQGTAEDFAENGIPVATIRVPRRDARNLCRLMRVLMDAVAVKGRLQGLHLDDAGRVNLAEELTYQQDGVEGYKQRMLQAATRMRAEK
jgi:glucose-6-phosphate isomerase